MPSDQTRASLELLFNISRELATTLDLHTLLARVLFLSVRHVEAERASLVVLDEQQKPVDAAIVTDNNLHPHTVEQLHAIVTQGLAGWVLRNRTAAFVPNTSQDERWLQREDDQLDHTGPKSAICVPLLAKDSLVGVLTIVHPWPDFFSDEQLALLQAIADIAGIAIRNAQLYTSMHAAQRRYAELFEDSIVPIVLTDWQGQIVEANRQMASFIGATLEALKAHTIMDLHDVNWDELGESFSRLRDGETLTYESVAQLEQAPSHPVQVYVRSTAAEEGLIQWILRDITERKELDSLRNDLTAMIYHDLRSPLANIVSSLDILNSLLPPEESASFQPVFQIAMRSTERLQRLISSLLDINRLEAGQAVTQMNRVEPDKLVAEAVEALRPIVDGKQQTLNSEVESGLPAIQADTDMIRRVLINLLENATKFSPLGGSLGLMVTRDGSWLRFSVEDSGQGIPTESREWIFEKFSRIKPEGTPKGFGLGLAFCKLAIQAHGGKIWVEDREPNGSRFVILLPIAGQTTVPA